MPVFTVCNSVFVFLGWLSLRTQSLRGAILVGVEVHCEYLYRLYVGPLSCSGEFSPLFSMILVEEIFETVPYLEVGGLSSPLLNVFVERGCLCQKGGPF